MTFALNTAFNRYFKKNIKMKLSVAKKKLIKINRLMDTFEPGDNNVSRLEKDLLLNYVRDFYEALQDENIEESNSQQGNKYEDTIREPAHTQNLIFEDKVEDEIQEDHTKVTSDKDYDSGVVTEELRLKRRRKDQFKQEPAPESPKVQAQTEQHEEESIVIEEEPSKPVSKKESKPEVDELFKIKKANEISEKLSQLPISDLNKAMGVNEKIYVKNELFGGDHSVFDQVIKKLNSLESFEDAKDFLSSEIAYTYEWVNPDKKNKAKNFIQLVYRRYK